MSKGMPFICVVEACIMDGMVHAWDMSWRPFWYMVSYVLVSLIHAWDISLVYCIWLLWFIFRITYFLYWHIFEVYLMVYGMMHVWGTLWYMVWILDVDMIYMSRSDWYINNMYSDRLKGMFNYRFMRQW